MSILFSASKVRILSVTPVISTSAYSANDAVGGLMTFQGVAGWPSGPAAIVGWSIIDKKQIKAALRLTLFDRIVTPAADNAAQAFSDADMANLVAYLSSGTYVDVGSTSSVYHADITPIYVAPFNGKNLYGQLLATATPTFTGVDDLIVKLHVAHIG